MYIDSKQIKLQLWDTAGQERFKSLIPSYIKDSTVAIIVFDISNKQSFASVPQWINEVKTIRGNETTIIIVGNKNDLADKRQVSEEEAKNLSKEQNATYFEASAKTGDNVNNIFTKMAYNLSGIDANANPPKNPDGYLI